MPEMRMIGYIKIRWYQQSVHGSNPRTSEKYNEPKVAINDTIEMKIKAVFKPFLHLIHPLFK